jgi:hypothetical protein
MSTNGDVEKAGSYKVGYRRPPKHGQFKKGQSGNPKGRPKGTQNLATVLASELRERVVINENGQRRTVTKMVAATKQLVNRAAGGDIKALHLLWVLVRSAEEQSVATTAPTAVLAAVDNRVMQGILERFNAAKKGSDQ